MLISLALSASAATLSVSGACGGPVSIDVTDLTPSGTYAILTAAAPGARTVSSGPCPGITLGLDAPFDVRRTGQVNASGELHISPALPAPVACGLYLQVVDVASCTPSNVVQIPGEDADGDGYYGAQDCDDGDALVYPGAPERCDGKRNDCDDSSWVDDAGLVTWYADDGAIIDRTADFAAGSPGYPETIVVPGDGELKICEGTYYASVQSTFGDGPVRVTGVAGSAATVIEAGLGTLSLTNDGPTRVSGITLRSDSSGAMIRPSATFDVEVTDVALDLPNGELLIADNIAGAGPVVVNGFTAPDSARGLNLQLDGSAHQVTVNNVAGAIRLDGLSAADCQATIADQVSGDTAANTGLYITACTTTVTDIVNDGDNRGMSLGAGAVVDAQRVTLTNNFLGLEVLSSTFVGTEVTVRGAAGQAGVQGSGSITLVDSVVEDCTDGGINVGGDVHLVDTIVRNNARSNGGGALIGQGSTLTCTKQDAAEAGFYDNDTAFGGGQLGGGAKLADGATPAVLSSYGCDWIGNAPNDVQVGGELDFEAFDFGADATFTCTSSSATAGCSP